MYARRRRGRYRLGLNLGLGLRLNLGLRRGLGRSLWLNLGLNLRLSLERWLDFYLGRHRFAASGTEFDVVGDLCPAECTKCHSCILLIYIM